MSVSAVLLHDLVAGTLLGLLPPLYGSIWVYENLASGLLTNRMV